MIMYKKYVVLQYWGKYNYQKNEFATLDFDRFLIKHNLFTIIKWSISFLHKNTLIRGQKNLVDSFSRVGFLFLQNKKFCMQNCQNKSINENVKTLNLSNSLGSFPSKSFFHEMKMSSYKLERSNDL